MKHQLILSEEFVPIRTLLNLALKDISSYHDEYISIMVHDAQEMIRDRSYRYRANKRVYKYSSYLSVSSREVITSMNPNRLGESEYRKLLKIFEDL